MAAVQPTPVGPGGAGGGSNSTTSNGTPGALPPGLTQQGVKDIYHKYQQLKQQGAGDDNPEFVKLRGILTTIQQQHQIRNRSAQYAAQQQQQQQQQQQFRQQHQHQQQQQNSQSHQNHVQTPQAQAQAQQRPQPSAGQQNGTSMSNASAANSTSVAPSPSPSLSSKAAPNANQKQAQANPSAKAATSTPAAAAGSQSFTPEQLATLRQQIVAFKMLSKNLSVPPSIQQQLFSSHQGKRPSTAGQAVAQAELVLDEAASQASGQGAGAKDAVSEDGITGNEQPGYKTATSPYSQLRKAISYRDHARRSARLMIPSIMPTGVDVDRMREERERVIYNRITARRGELEKLPANISSWDTRKGDSPSGEDSLKLKALLEYKMLCLLPRQRALRQQMCRDMVHHDNLAMTANRAMYRRMKKQSLREARITEKLEKQQRDARESREKKKHVDYLQAIISHGREIQSAAASQRNRVQKLGRMMMNHHQQIEKEEQKRVERTAKQRLQALKANDEEAYLKLLGQAKDTRITHLLKQTDGFLNQLAASVRQQQRAAAERYGDYPLEEEESADEDEDEDEDGGKKIDYYQVAHRIKEEVTQQPGLLIGGTLKEYQMKGLQWMISLYNNNLNGILADEMGLGKTIQTISLLTHLIEKKKQNGPFLVIVPLSTLTNWNIEFEKWAPSISRIVYKGPPNARKQQQQSIRYGNFQVLLTTYEFIIKDRPVLSKIKWVHMIVDEGHRMKNAQSKLSSTLTQYYNSRYRLILTGTPLQNNLPELWALLNFVLPTIFKSVKSFDEWFNTPFANTGGQDKMELTEEEQLLVIRRLHKVLRPFLLRRLKVDVERDLPEKQERVVKCVFSALQAKLYKQMMTDQKILVGDGKGGKTGIRGLSNMLMQLRKLCNHPYVFQEVEDQINPSKSIDDSLWRTAGKFELLDRILPKFQESGHRVLMFFQMTNIMNIMEDYMRLREMQYLRLDGTTKSDDRSELLKQFNEPNSPYFCFLLSTRAGGLGLNLQTADTVIIFDSDWNPHQDLQAQDRAHRIGQKNEVRILRLISSNSIEEKILERAQYKLDMDGKVIQAGKFDNKSTNEEREALLRTLMDGAEATENLDQEEMDDDDLNVIMARSDQELERFREMDIERARDSPYGPDRKYPRLLSEAELPDIYLNEGGPVIEEVEEYAGRGARQRTQVKYDDGLTEEQWLDAVDAEDDTIENAVARKQARMAKRQANKERKARAGVGGDDTMVSDGGEDSETPPPKKRGRKPKSNEKRKADEAALDQDTQAPASKRKRGRGSVRPGGSIGGAASSAPSAGESAAAEERAVLQKALLSVFQTLMTLETTVSDSEDEDEEGPTKRTVIDPFKKVPPKSLYPDYYMVIQTPIAMDMIKKKIQKEDYGSLRDFQNDIRTLCTNARTYNEDGSILFQDANLIEDTCLEKLRGMADRHSELNGAMGLQDQGERDDDDDGGTGGSAPPMDPPPSAGRLKLTFNASGMNGDGDDGLDGVDGNES